MGLFGSCHASIDVSEANRRAQAGEVVLVDVREQNEWQGGHAPMAKHVPLGSLSAKLPELAKSGKPVAFICLSGGRSGKACGTASKAGIEAINVKGGMGAWTSAGLPVAR
ncbi:MAG: rhodanese-like domain-containing protein [Gaiellales bacterium]